MRSFNKVRLTALFILAGATFILSGCPQPAAPYCGDGNCNGNETAASCPQDCPQVCGDTYCTGTENASTCARDCPMSCGDGYCTGNENSDTCRRDCPETCGDGYCSSAERMNQSCPTDCGNVGYCGDGTCNDGETASSCPSDCAACTNPSYPVDCGDGTGCWSTGTNCSSNVFICGNAYRRCQNTSDIAFCCSNAFITCPGAAPYYCPQDNLCYPGGSLPGYCNASTCTLILGDC